MCVQWVRGTHGCGCVTHVGVSMCCIHGCWCVVSKCHTHGCWYVAQGPPVGQILGDRALWGQPATGPSWWLQAARSNVATLSPSVSAGVQPLGGGEAEPRTVRQQRAARHGRVSGSCRCRQNGASKPPAASAELSSWDPARVWVQVPAEVLGLHL